jgi:hypothetical protein
MVMFWESFLNFKVLLIILLMRSLLLVFALLFSYTLSAQVIHILEDFNTSALPIGWTTSAVSGTTTWSFGIDGSLNIPGISNLDGTPMAFFDDDALGSSAVNNTAQLVTPAFDNLAYSITTLEFDYNFRQLPAPLDSFYVEVYDGLNWTTVFSTTTNDCGNWIGACQGNFPKATIDISSFANASCQVRFTYFDGNGWSWYVGLDNVVISSSYRRDIGVSKILSPRTTGCELGSNETIEVEVSNFGTDTIHQFSIVCDINNGTVVIIDTVNTVLLPLDTLIYNFNSTANFSGTTNYNLEVYTMLLNDSSAANDTTTGILESKVTILPNYLDDFEGSNNWFVLGNNPSWELGIPNNTIIDTAVSGRNAYVTNLTGNYNNYESSYLRSSCFDFSQIRGIPLLEFNLNYFLESDFDTLKLEYTTDGGLSWNSVEAGYSNKNWYSLNRSWSGNSGGWIDIKNTLVNLKGASNVRFQFSFSTDGSVTFEGVGLDNFKITDTDSLNIGIDRLVNPTPLTNTTCGLGVENIEIELNNLGMRAIDSVFLFYRVNGGFIFTDTLVQNLTPLSLYPFIFKNQFDFSAQGNYNLEIWAKANGDTLPMNDSVSLFVQNTQGPILKTMPYIEKFSAPNFIPGSINFNRNDTIGSDWTRSNGLFTWRVANSKRFRHLDTGPDRDQNGLNSSFIYAESRYGFINDTAVIESSCINLSNFVPYTLEFKYHRFGDTSMPSLYVDIYNGTSWQQVADVSGNDQLKGNDSWSTYAVNLDQFAGSKIKLRFRTIKSGCCRHVMAVDDIKVYERKAIDVSISRLSSIEKDCKIEDSLRLEVANFGAQNITGSIPFSYSVNGGASRGLTIPLLTPLSPNQKIEFNFSPSANLGVNAINEITVWTDLLLDTNFVNDSNRIVVENNIQKPNKYKENFDSWIDASCTRAFAGYSHLSDQFDSGWKHVGTDRNSWNVQNGANCFGTYLAGTGPNLDHTSGAGNFMFIEGSFSGNTAILESPCIDFSSDSTAGLSFWYHRYGVHMDTLFVDVFANGIWNYGVDSLVGQSQAASTDPWKLRKVIFNQFAGQVIKVRFRAKFGVGGFGDSAIDDVEFFTPLQQDAWLTEVDLVQTSCEEDSAKLLLTVNNLGLDSILPNQLKLHYQINNGAVISDTIRVGLTVDSSLTFLLNIPNLYNVNNQRITAWVELPNDSNSFNDTLYFDIDLPSRAPEYIEGFENIVPSNWFCGNYTPLNLAWKVNEYDKWVVGHDSICHYGIRGATPTFSTGPDSAFAGHGFIYFEPGPRVGSPKDTAILTSTCIDLRNDSISFLDFYYHMYGAETGTLYVDILANGTITRLDSIVGQQHHSRSNPWSLKIINLNQFAGDIISIRFTAIESPGFNSELGNISIDNVRISNSFPVSVNEALEYSNTLQLFPNPTNGEFILRGNGFSTSEHSISVMDLNGRVIESRVVNPTSNSINERFDLSNQANGIYFISIQSEGKIEVKKVVLSGS